MSGTSPVDSFKSLSKFDQGVLATGVLAFIVSFFPWYGFSVPGVTIGTIHEGGGSASISAWHSYSTFAILLILVATALAAVSIFAKDSVPDLPIGVTWLVAGLSVLGTLLELLRLLTVHHGDGFSIKWGGYLLVIVMAANSAFAVLAARAGSEPAPWENRGATAPPPPPAAPPAPPTA
jgi:hypothetical protein